MPNKGRIGGYESMPCILWNIRSSVRYQCFDGTSKVTCALGSHPVPVTPVIEDHDGVASDDPSFAGPSGGGGYLRDSSG